MLIMIFFICLSIVFAIVTAIYLNKKKTNNNRITEKTNKIKKKDTKKKSKRQLKDIFNIKVKDSMICIGNRYSYILKLGSVDYNMLSDNEQETIENVLMQTAISLDNPIQFFTTTENIDTTMIIEKIKETKSINSEIKKCKENLIEFLYELMEDRNISLVKNYAIISYDGLYKDAFQDLHRKALGFKSNLLRGKIQCEILNDEEIYNLIYRELNKNSNIIKLNLNKEGEKLYVSKKEKNKKRK